MNAQNPLSGARILIVEDEAILAMLVEDILEDMGCVVAGIVGSVQQGLEFLARGGATFDAAILDVNLGGEKVFPLADALAERGLPFLFATGYGSDGIEGRFAGRPVLSKPFQRRDLEEHLAKVLAERRS